MIDIFEVKKKMRIRALMTAGFVGTILNLLNNSNHLLMLFGIYEFSWSGLGKIFFTYLVPFAVASYSQKNFIPLYVALLNIKNAFYILDQNNKITFVSNNLIDELNENGGKEKPFNSSDIKGMEIEDLALKFGFRKRDTVNLLRNFSEGGVIDDDNKVLGHLVNGKRYSHVIALNPAVCPGSKFPAQGMFICKNALGPCLSSTESGPKE